jgi:hypothetical protein
MRLLAEEAEEHQDIVILDVSTVGNGWVGGKTLIER